MKRKKMAKANSKKAVLFAVVADADVQLTGAQIKAIRELFNKEFPQKRAKRKGNE